MNYIFEFFNYFDIIERKIVETIYNNFSFYTILCFIIFFIIPICLVAFLIIVIILLFTRHKTISKNNNIDNN